MKRLPLITSFFLFIVLCMSAAYWAMQFFTPPLRLVALPPAETIQPVTHSNGGASLFGGSSTAPVASNYLLKGVMISSIPAESVAILATNGKPAQAIKANAEVAPGVAVKEVNRGYVLLSEGGVIKRVDLPENVKQTKVSTPLLPARK